MENEKKCVCLKILLDVNKERIWKALTDPSLTEKHMYNCQLHSSCEINSDALWKQKNEDETFTTHEEAKVFEYSPYNKLRFLIFHNSDQYDIKESELNFTLEDQSTGVLLKIEQGNFPQTPEGKQLFEECLAGWNFVSEYLITSIKELT